MPVDFKYCASDSFAFRQLHEQCHFRSGFPQFPHTSRLNLSHSTRRCQDREQKMLLGTWLVEHRFSVKPKVVTTHSGVSYSCLPVPMVRHSPLHASTSALGKGLSEDISLQSNMKCDVYICCALCRAVMWHVPCVY